MDCWVPSVPIPALVSSEEEQKLVRLQTPISSLCDLSVCFSFKSVFWPVI